MIQIQILEMDAHQAAKLNQDMNVQAQDQAYAGEAVEMEH